MIDPKCTTSLRFLGTQSLDILVKLLRNGLILLVLALKIC